MELIKAPIIADKRDVTLNDYLEEVQKSNDVEVSEEDIEIVNKDEDAYILVDDKYEYLLEKEDDGNLKITYQGKVGKLKPRITSIEVTNTTNSITVKVNAKYADEYKFYIGTSTENYEEKEINETGEFTFTKLTQNVTYYIKVEAINDNGTATEEIQRTTGTIVTEEGAITFGNITWDGTTHKASVSISTNTEYGIKYNVNGTTEELEDIIKWNSYTQSLTGLIVGDTVYACLSDGTNIGKTYASIKITDGTNPTVPNQIETSVTKTTITATASGSTDLEGEIAGYQYSLDGKSWTETKALGTAHTFTGISTLTTKTIYARAVDGVNHISEAKTVTATTLPEEYTITYDANEGEGAPEAQTKTQATELTLSSTVPTRTGYNFLGWSTSSTATTVTYTAGGKYTTDSGTTLYAVWSAKTVKVTFMRNTSSTDTTSAIQTFTYGVENQSFSAKGWSKTGYTLLGWNTYKEATEAKHPVTSGVAQYWIESNSPETTLYAVWSPNTNTAYKVVHQQMNVNGSGYTTVLTEPLTGTTGASVTPAVKSYTGFTSPSTQTVTIAADGSTTVTYKYARRKFKFTLGTGTGVSTSGSTASGEYYYGATINLKATASTGYTWSKWTSSNTGLVANTTTANTTFAMPAGAVTMTPSAAAKTVKVIFMRNTSSTDTTKAEQTFTYGVTGQSFSNKGWSRSGYTLLGWDFDKNATTQRYSVTNGVIDSWIANNSPSVTLYAIWKVNHTHVASCYHSHTDSCYNITYHSHSNSCYSYTYHSHSNSCYKYTYHSHSSSCYHSHSSSCYSSCSGGTVGVSSSSTSTCSSCGNKSYTTNVMKCSKCSATSTFKGCSRCGSGPVGSFSHSRILSCTKSTSSATCGKTTSTVESSTLTCGKTTSTVASSTLTCGKSTSTIESKSLKCTTSTSTPLCGY